MSTENTNGFNPHDKGLGKNKKIKAQTKIIFKYFLEHTDTNTMVSIATGIPQKNICRIKRNLEKQGLLIEVERKLCKHTGHKAWYLTTNPKRFNIN